MRPCPFVSCKWHLAIDVTNAGNVKLNFPGRDVTELEDTCALDVAERGRHTYEEIGVLMNMSGERVRQVVERALDKLYAAMRGRRP